MNLSELADELTDRGFPCMADTVREYIADPLTWATPARLCEVLVKDVWYNFAHVGEDHERGLYADTAELIRSTFHGVTP